ncbi:PstS family phosphate ABC transporter substrate-binding protein [Klebsiella oxytoca]|uniref:PstS family phosphate ABC transporter substrate-binding protein n=1 Tax=Klebsiella oxytoca TaxID=571 RepID=UPI002DBC9D0F|nr:PstS family phosphate ABC transporter substrate-binding protein [Klebsiella oxytoca]MEB7875486.1 PstS family phosphate ABC transporter substrate-binding protein [Klebsiella oxytoca]HCK0932447.1 PstS family phosphate ABC transporter substrate-binding protein [Klebsiella oxytoca]
MKNTKWLLLSVILAFFGVPILTHVAALVLAMVGGGLALVTGLFGESQTAATAIAYLMFAAGAALMFASGRVWSDKQESALLAGWRQSLLLLPVLMALLTWIIMLQRAELSFKQLNFFWLSTFLLPWFGISVLSALSGWYWGIVVIPVGSQLCFTLGYYWPYRHVPIARNASLCRCILLAVLALLGAYALYQAWLHEEKYPSVSRNNSVLESINTGNFAPGSCSKLTPLQGPPQLRFTQNWPRMAGATAAYPLYASAFYALNTLPATFSTRDYLHESRTPDAWRSIITGETDIIFVVQPSAGQKQRAQDAGVKLVYTPFAREAFVFIANQSNSVQSLSEEQIRAIFSGKITRWSDVGGASKAIQPWQRPEDSGSQTVMLAKVMKGVPMLPPKKSEFSTVMEGVIREVAEYQNTRGAIGYTFRYYATQMNSNKHIKLLSINGIAPTVENIRNGSYPYTVDVYMVTREHTSAETQQLVAWFLSPQGQHLVQDVGYVPMYKTQE